MKICKHCGKLYEPLPLNEVVEKAKSGEVSIKHYSPLICPTCMDELWQEAEKVRHEE